MFLFFYFLCLAACPSLFYCDSDILIIEDSKLSILYHSAVCAYENFTCDRDCCFFSLMGLTAEDAGEKGGGG